MIEKKPSICIILCYYGKFPLTFQLFLKSCLQNPTINWLIVTDDNGIEKKFVIPKNVQILNMSLFEVEQLASQKIGFRVIIPTPYKLCDYKVAYGLIFEEFLKNYEWWGYGDCDVVYGDLRKYFTNERLNQYDKVYPLGHLSVLRNNEQCKKAFLLSADGTYDAKYVYTNDKTFGFDEHDGINLKMLEHGMKIDLSNDFVDRSTFFKRFRTIDKKDIIPYFDESWIHSINFLENYKKQLFVWENGHAYQYYMKNNKIKQKELCYIHYRCRYENNIDFYADKYILGAKELVSISGNNSLISAEDFDKYNQSEPREMLKKAIKCLRSRIDGMPEAEGIIIFLKKMKKLLYKKRK